MKKILYTFLAISIIFTACKKEDEVVVPTVVNGCTDATATNYNSLATNDDGTCVYPPAVINGCTDSIATNYNALATVDDGSCTFGIVGGAWITDSEVVDIHMVASMGGVVLLDSSWTETENNPDSMEQAVQKFWDNGEVKFWDNNNNLVDSGTWVQSGTTVTITTDTVIVGEVISVTKTNLVHQVVGNGTFTDSGVDYDIDYIFTGYHTRDENGFTTNNINQRKRNTSWINKRKLINSIKP